jgi:hypothetical protein
MRGCACFVPEPGQNIHLPLSKKKQAGMEIVGFFVGASGVVWRKTYHEGHEEHEGG